MIDPLVEAQVLADEIASRRVGPEEREAIIKEHGVSIDEVLARLEAERSP